MPGPSNKKKRAKAHKKKSKAARPSAGSQVSEAAAAYRDDSSSPSSPSPGQLATPPPPPLEVLHALRGKDEELEMGRGAGCHSDEDYDDDELVPQTPYIHDPGNGPRVRDTRVFLNSYFAQPPSLDDPLCAEFAQEEVLQMLCTILPEETALILWYNKSRSTGRVCPACQRLYRLGDVLPDLIVDEEVGVDGQSPPQLAREQEISGLCSPVCFILASFNYPGAIKSAWGHTADEMAEDAWELLNSPGKDNARGDIGLGLGMLVKMTRLDDLGLAQLCMPELDFEEEEFEEEVPPHGLWASEVSA